MLSLSTFALQAMEPEVIRQTSQPGGSALGALAWRGWVPQGRQQPSELRKVWFNLARRYDQTGVIDQQLVAQFNRLREEGFRFDFQPGITATDIYLRQQLGITDEQWQELMPQ